jgi:hypothetical protein
MLFVNRLAPNDLAARHWEEALATGRTKQVQLATLQRRNVSEQRFSLSIFTLFY